MYLATAKNIGDLNLVFGRNDSGKSNFLRALNLFFNGEVGVDEELDFNLDFSDTRREEAREVKGRQFISVRIDFDVPPNFQKSLGRELSIKRQWNIFGEMTETPPRNLTTNQKRQLTKFLNQIDYTYVPAIKDSEVFSDLIERLYNSFSEGQRFQSSTVRFVDSIRKQTNDLSIHLSDMFQSPSQIAAPSEMGLLFRSLDFAHGKEGHSLINQKGDGVKARHIPALLRFINENEKAKFFVWGFEEPENSLDLAAAELEAASFGKFASKAHTQVFISSHSPAFYLAEIPDNNEAHVTRYFICKQEKIDKEDKVSPKDAISQIGSFEDAETLMSEASLLQLPYVIRQLSSLKEDRDAKSKQLQELEEKILNLEKPSLFVEGKHDIKLFEKAFSELGLAGKISVFEFNGTPNNTHQLLKKLSSGSALQSKVFLLFDNDHSGRKSYREITKEVPNNLAAHNLNDRIYSWCVPTTEEFSAFTLFNSIGLDQIIFTADFMFPGEPAAQLLESLMTEAELQEAEGIIHNSYNKSLSQGSAKALRGAKRGTKEWLWARGVPDGQKAQFYQKSEDLDRSHLVSTAKIIADALGD